jgi:hypothetical protein
MHSLNRVEVDNYINDLALLLILLYIYNMTWVCPMYWKLCILHTEIPLWPKRKKNALVGGFVRDGSIQKYKDLNTI